MTQTKERRELKTSSNFMFMAFRSQSGVLEKAILEGVMNSVDAGATSIHVKLSASKIQIIDDGEGMQTQKHIEDYFEVVGAEHQMDSDGYSADARFGTFRMGRGQMFVYGVNHWRTGTFLIDLDMKNQGLSYDLTTGLAPYNGCAITIDLYDFLEDHDRRYMARSFSNLVKYLDIPVYLEDTINLQTKDPEKINTPPSECDWDYEDEDFYIKYSKESVGLHIYQQGVYVECLWGEAYGVTGTVVSKKALKLNLSRNSVLRNECKRWKRLHTILKEQASKSLLGVGNKNPDLKMRAAMLDQWACGELGQKRSESKILGQTKLFEDVSGKCWSINMIKAAYRRFEKTPGQKLQVAFAESGSSLGCRIMDFQKALVFSKIVLSQLSMSPSACLDWICEKDFFLSGKLQSVELDAVDQDFKRGIEVFDPKDHTDREKLFCRVMQKISSDLEYSMHQRDPQPNFSYRDTRRVTIGSWKGSAAFTDGETFVAFDRDYLKKSSFSSKSLFKFYAILVHELCHDAPDTGDTHNHTFQFYEKFESVIMDTADVANKVGLYFAKEAARSGKKLTKEQLEHIKKSKEALTNDEIINEILNHGDI